MIGSYARNWKCGATLLALNLLAQSHDRRSWNRFNGQDPLIAEFVDEGRNCIEFVPGDVSCHQKPYRSTVPGPLK